MNETSQEMNASHSTKTVSSTHTAKRRESTPYD